MILRRPISEVFRRPTTDVEESCEQCGYPGLADHERDFVFMVDGSDSVFCSRRCAADAMRHGHGLIGGAV